jgi:hypothetical protein
LSTQVAPKGDTVFCRECGKPIEADARFCRFCGKAQADRSVGMAASSGSASRSTSSTSRAADGLERWLRQLFPRHHLQDAFSHLGAITAFFLALIGFVLGFITPALFGDNFLSSDFLLASIALLLFLILRESTLSHIRTRGTDAGPAADSGRYHAARRSSTADLPTEAATTQSSPPTSRPASPSPPSSAGRPPGKQ